jgi:hypothetical protein
METTILGKTGLEVSGVVDALRGLGKTARSSSSATTVPRRRSPASRKGRSAPVVRYSNPFDALLD